MIGYVKGKVTGIFKDFCFVECGGIGWRVFVSGKDSARLHSGEEAKLFTYMSVREDAMQLYGFLSQEAYDLFLILISVSKIGPKIALGILSTMEPSAFAMAVRNKNTAALTKLPGIGKRTAERLIVELKDKVGTMENSEGEIPDFFEEPQLEGIYGEAVAALRSLGYEMSEITPVLAKLNGQFTDARKLIGAALREIGKSQF